MLDGLTAWWDTFELWLAQRWFPVQFVLVMAVLVPLCLGVAWVLGWLVDRLPHRFGVTREQEPPGRS
ncbi:hypothetical protein SAMN05421810_104129 [Amycolatopsis arida]|uniref:Uncharacterized protein n=1 Tax=Amycolatopsis arida TaxID=587909 RepID=A0A1I5UVD7_9PSEU|nr:hypothetical protein [Amycolatopsis arida]TDX91048.1 hypothetical protein CLV69_106128 [Amycolatopsis arida]SFP99215.1 hypothetical protein SAMN05421810_104129 [Amycolatopsis arida]